MPFLLPDDELPQATAPWIASARWFGGKALSDVRFRVHDLAPAAADDGPVALAVIDVQAAAPGDEPLRYAVPLEAVAAATPVLRDAAGSPAFADWLVRTVLDGGTVRGRRGEFRGHAIGPAIPLPAGALPAVTPIGGDASNTSLVVRWGDRSVIVKLLRRCREGVQPEVEIGSFLAGQAGWRESPRLLGWLEYVETPPDDAPAGVPASTAIATVHACVPGGESAWDRLVSLLTAADPHGREGRGPGAEALRLAAALGHSTARMHRALGGRDDVPAFAPRPMTPAMRCEAAARMADHAREVFSLAAARLPHLPAATADRLRKLLPARDRLIARLRELADIETTAAVIRVHGDYHLGQVLVGGATPSDQADDRLFIIDFEGEPGRPLAERRAATSVFKDVAGMCRSFDYLLRHVTAGTGTASRPADLRRLEETFLEAYAAAASGQPWWPADPREAERLLGVYKLDKAVYELAYEIQNRPDWIAVPLGALEEMAT
jgi:trehalose synthase-fused probable maltokinase